MAIAGWTRRHMIDRYPAATAVARAADESRGSRGGAGTGGTPSMFVSYRASSTDGTRRASGLPVVRGGVLTQAHTGLLPGLRA